MVLKLLKSGFWAAGAEAGGYSSASAQPRDAGEVFV